MPRKAAKRESDIGDTKREPVDIESKMARFHNRKTYAITINPDDKLQFPKGNRLAGVRLSVIELFRDYRSYIHDLQLWVDVSFPDNLRAGLFPRVHYHGTIKFKDIHGFLIHYNPFEHHSVNIDTIDDKEYWKAYCRKYEDLHDTVKMYRIDYNHLKDDMVGVNPDNLKPLFKDLWKMDYKGNIAGDDKIILELD